MHECINPFSKKTIRGIEHPKFKIPLNIVNTRPIGLITNDLKDENQIIIKNFSHQFRPQVATIDLNKVISTEIIYIQLRPSTLWHPMLRANFEKESVKIYPTEIDCTNKTNAQKISNICLSNEPIGMIGEDPNKVINFFNGKNINYFRFGNFDEKIFYALYHWGSPIWADRLKNNFPLKSFIKSYLEVSNLQSLKRPYTLVGNNCVKYFSSVFNNTKELRSNNIDFPVTSGPRRFRKKTIQFNYLDCKNLKVPVTIDNSGLNYKEYEKYFLEYQQRKLAYQLGNLEL
jgi:hypothetical protein